MFQIIYLTDTLRTANVRAIESVMSRNELWQTELQNLKLNLLPNDSGVINQPYISAKRS